MLLNGDPAAPPVKAGHGATSQKVFNARNQAQERAGLRRTSRVSATLRTELTHRQYVHLRTKNHGPC